MTRGVGHGASLPLGASVFPGVGFGVCSKGATLFELLRCDGKDAGKPAGIFLL